MSKNLNLFFSQMLSRFLPVSAEGQPVGGAGEGGSQCPSLLQDNRGQDGCGEESAGDVARLSQQGARSHPAPCAGRNPDTAQVSQ